MGLDPELGAVGFDEGDYFLCWRSLSAPKAGQSVENLVGALEFSVPYSSSLIRRDPHRTPWGCSPCRCRLILDFACRCRLGLVVGMVDDQRGIDVDIQRRTSRGRCSGGPGRLPRRGAGLTNLRQVRGVDAMVDQPPHRRGRGLRPDVNTCSRSPHSCPTPSMQSAPSATAAARSANTAPAAYTHGPL